MKNIARFLVVPLVLMNLFFVPAPVAQAQDDEVTIEDLLAQIEELKAQLEELMEQRGEVQQAVREVRLNIIRYLQQGASGEDVERLQEYLALDPEIYPEGLITGYFGPLTFQAVRRFQKRHGIDQVGAVGPQTRARLHDLFDRGWGPNDLPPGLEHAPGIDKKGGACAVPGIAKKLSFCGGELEDEDEDEDEDSEELEVEGVVASLSDDELVLEDDTTFVIDEDTEIEEGVEVGSTVDVEYEIDGDDWVATEVELDDDEEDDDEDEDDDDEDDEEEEEDED